MTEGNNTDHGGGGEFKWQFWHFKVIEILQAAPENCSLKGISNKAKNKKNQYMMQSHPWCVGVA